VLEKSKFCLIFNNWCIYDSDWKNHLEVYTGTGGVAQVVVCLPRVIHCKEKTAIHSHTLICCGIMKSIFYCCILKILRIKSLRIT
jgi:hypothetical protein